MFLAFSACAADLGFNGLGLIFCRVVDSDGAAVNVVAVTRLIAVEAVSLMNQQCVKCIVNAMLYSCIVMCFSPFFLDAYVVGHLFDFTYAPAYVLFSHHEGWLHS